MPGSHMVPLTTCPFAFEAKVLTARLGAEGIVWQASANLDSIYPVGDVEIMVGEDDLDRAVELLDVEQLEPEDEDDQLARRDRRRQRITAVALLVLVALFLTARMLAGR